MSLLWGARQLARLDRVITGVNQFVSESSSACLFDRIEVRYFDGGRLADRLRSQPPSKIVIPGFDNRKRKDKVTVDCASWKDAVVFYEHPRYSSIILDRSHILGNYQGTEPGEGVSERDMYYLFHIFLHLLSLVSDQSIEEQLKFTWTANTYMRANWSGSGGAHNIFTLRKDITRAIMHPADFATAHRRIKSVLLDIQTVQQEIAELQSLVEGRASEVHRDHIAHKLLAKLRERQDILTGTIRAYRRAELNYESIYGAQGVKVPVDKLLADLSLTL